MMKMTLLVLLALSLSISAAQAADRYTSLDCGVKGFRVMDSTGEHSTLPNIDLPTAHQGVNAPSDGIILNANAEGVKINASVSQNGSYFLQMSLSSDLPKVDFMGMDSSGVVPSTGVINIHGMFYQKDAQGKLNTIDVTLKCRAL